MLNLIATQYRSCRQPHPAARACGALPASAERYPVPGGGSVLVDVRAGDTITVTDVEGGQACEIVFCDAQGRFDPAGLGASGDGSANGLKAMLARNAEGAMRTLAALRRRKVDLAQARSVGLFGPSSLAKAQRNFRRQVRTAC